MIFAFGIDWKTAPLATREQCAVLPQDIPAALHKIRAVQGVHGCALLQTCNRFALYMDADEGFNSALLPATFAALPPLPNPARQLMEVAAGLHSQILGEEQILTQVREAAQTARQAGTASPVLETLFRLAVTAGKAVRTEVVFKPVPTSAAHKALELAKEVLGGLAGKHAVVIGNGEMGRLTAGLLVEAGCKVTITLRSYRHGQTLVPPGCGTIPYANRAKAIDGCDLLVSATKSPHYTVALNMLRGLATPPNLVVDIALPRDIEPACRDMQGLAFYDMDDLRDDTIDSENPAIAQAQSILDKHMADYEKWLAGRLAYKQQAPARPAYEKRATGGPAAPKLAVFAGTSEGRALCTHLAGAGMQAAVFVATGYASTVLPPLPGMEIHTGRLDEAEMAAALQGFATVVDATHPYAVQASRNIAAAARQAGARYIRLVRPASEARQEVVCVENAKAAAAYLAQTSGKVLLTTGSKDLPAYTAVPGFAQRLYPRILPDAGALAKCRALGFLPANTICMQGPFTHEMNAALLHSIGAGWLVTKDTGTAGGLSQKLSAAGETGAKVLMIARPDEAVKGHTLAEVCKILTGSAPGQTELLPAEQTAALDVGRFPLFIDIQNKPCLVVGGGAVGLRRCRVLQGFGAKVTLVAPACGNVPDSVRLVAREFLPGDTKGMALVVAATDSRACNHAIAVECGENGIPVSVADCPEECSFYFPAICQAGNLVAGVVSTDNSHTRVAAAAAAIRKTMEELQP